MLDASWPPSAGILDELLIGWLGEDWRDPSCPPSTLIMERWSRQGSAEVIAANDAFVARHEPLIGAAIRAGRDDVIAAATQPAEALALVILLDQFPRMLYTDVKDMHRVCA
jgi:uncharacterized protein (DUF924 family)